MYESLDLYYQNFFGFGDFQNIFTATQNKKSGIKPVFICEQKWFVVYQKEYFSLKASSIQSKPLNSPFRRLLAQSQ